jgi:hypothetical protein
MNGDGWIQPPAPVLVNGLKIEGLFTTCVVPFSDNEPVLCLFRNEEILAYCCLASHQPISKGKQFGWLAGLVILNNENS